MRKGEFLLRLLLAGVLGALGLPALAASATSSFDDGTLQGWQAIGDVASVSNPGTGGNPGGYVNMRDRAVGGVVWMVAPAEYLGNWHNKVSLSVDLVQFTYSGSQFSPVKFEISGPGGKYTRVFGERPPLTNWRTYGTTMDESLWEHNSGTWSALLDDVQELRILLEYIDGGETNGMDNVALLEDCQEVLIGHAKTLPDGTCVTVNGIVTRVLPEAMYIQEADRSAGIRVKNNFALSEGDVVTLNATVALENGERILDNATVLASQPGALPDPLHVQLQALGGAGVSVHDPATAPGIGLKNTGLLVRITGRVTAHEDGAAVVDDGSAAVRVRLEESLALPPVGVFLSLSGVSSVQPGDGSQAGILAARDETLHDIPLGINIVRNPGSEEGESDTGPVVRPIPGWEATSNFSVADYGSVNVTVETGEAIDGGRSFFYGGQSNPFSEAVQVLDVSALAEMVDDGILSADLSGYIGGWSTQTDYGTVKVTFLDGSDGSLGSFQIGPQGGSNQEMIFHEADSAVPAGTRKVEVRMIADRNVGSENSVYIDNVSLVLSESIGIAF